MPRLTAWLRSRLLFRLLLVTPAACCIALGCLTIGVHFYRVQPQRSAVATLRELGDRNAKANGVRVEVIYDTDRTGSSVPKWLLEGVGRDHFHSVVALDVGLSGGEAEHGEAFAKAIELMRKLPHLRELRLRGPNPLDIKRIARLEGKIESLSIQSPRFDSPIINIEEHRPRFDALIERNRRLVTDALEHRDAQQRRFDSNRPSWKEADPTGDKHEKLSVRFTRNDITREVNEERFYANLADLPGLTELTLNQVSTTFRKSDAAESIFRPISRCRSLMMLRLHGCGVRGSDLLPLANSPELTFLSIQNSIAHYCADCIWEGHGQGQDNAVRMRGYYRYSPVYDGGIEMMETINEALQNHEAKHAREEEWLRQILPKVQLDPHRMYSF